MKSAVALAPGFLLADRYRVLGPLGSGGMAVVYEAMDETTRSRVALKLMHAGADEKQRLRFSQEARACMRLTSRYNVRLLDEGLHAGEVPFLVFERLYGSELAKEMAGRVIATAEVVDWCIDACHGLAEAHARNIVHRDIKPENLFICDYEKRRYLKVLDFGISKLLGEYSLTGKASVLGTPLYMAPEHMKGERATAASDQFSLAVVLYEAISGRLPFHGTSNAEYMLSAVTAEPLPLRPRHGEASPGLEFVIKRALGKFAASRFESTLELAEALRPYGTGLRDDADDARPTDNMLAADALPETERWGTEGAARRDSFAPDTAAEGPRSSKSSGGARSVPSSAPRSRRISAQPASIRPASKKPSGRPVVAAQGEVSAAPRRGRTFLMYAVTLLLACAIGIAIGSFGIARLVR